MQIGLTHEPMIRLGKGLASVDDGLVRGFE